MCGVVYEQPLVDGVQTLDAQERGTTLGLGSGVDLKEKKRVRRLKYQNLTKV